MTTTRPSDARRRTAQREATRERIVEAALAAFADRGFDGASTRDIARRAGTNQGLITYHFRSKDELWRAAADRIFGQIQASLREQLAGFASRDPRERLRELVRAYVRFAAAHPELFRLMVGEGNQAEPRMAWLVDTHLRPRWRELAAVLGGEVGLDASLRPHFWYALAGAGSLMFAVAPECRRLTGVDPEEPDVVERHAAFVARLLVP